MDVPFPLGYYGIFDALRRLQRMAFMAPRLLLKRIPAFFLVSLDDGVTGRPANAKLGAKPGLGEPSRFQERDELLLLNLHTFHPPRHLEPPV